MPKDKNYRDKNITVIAVILSVAAVSFAMIPKYIQHKIHEQDTTVIYITPPSSSSASSSNSSDTSSELFPETTEVPLYININTASKDELMRLKGIGSVLADRIISYRTENGSFRNIEELMYVSGIGSELFAGLCGFIFVENPIYEVTTTSAETTSATVTSAETTTRIPETTVHIPTLEECAPININTADVELLMLLPYIDEEKALEIIDIRERIGGYSHVYEILLIESLTQPQAAEIVNYICVE